MSSKHIEMGAALIVIIGCGGLAFEAFSYSNGSQILPIGILAIAFCLSFFWLAQTIIGDKGTSQSSDEEPQQKPIHFITLTSTVLLVALYLVLIPAIGFYTTTLIAIPAICYATGFRNVKQIFFGTIIFSLIVFIVFRLVLAVPLPDEILVTWMEQLS